MDEKFPDLNKDRKVTYADILIGRGVREQKSIGGLLKKLMKLTKADKDKDIDEILDELTPAQMDKLSPTEKEQLLDLQLEKYGVDGPKIKDIEVNDCFLMTATCKHSQSNYDGQEQTYFNRVKVLKNTGSIESLDTSSMMPATPNIKTPSKPSLSLRKIP